MRRRILGLMCFAVLGSAFALGESDRRDLRHDRRDVRHDRVDRRQDRRDIHRDRRDLRGIGGICGAIFAGVSIAKRSVTSGTFGGTSAT
jgi:hypothetical protein